MHSKTYKSWGLLALGSVAASTVLGANYYSEDHGLPIADVNFGYGRNDDGFFGPINLGFDFDFFGVTYNQFFINNNGNVSFGGGVNSFTGIPLDTQTLRPMIAPFFSDVDTRNPASDLVYLNDDVANQLIVTWNSVGYFGSHADKLNSFQLVLRGPDYLVPEGEGQIGFFYKAMDWETGDASGGAGGFGGTEGTAGFGDGLAASTLGEISITGSQEAGISDILQDNHYWFVLGETGTPEIVPTEVPEASTWGAAGLVGAAGLLGWLRRRKA